MKSFPSLRDMLCDLVKPLAMQYQQQLSDSNGKLWMSTSCFDDASEILFCREELGVKFQHMQIIANPAFFHKVESITITYPDAYGGIARNVIWKSIDNCIRCHDPIHLHPITFISMSSSIGKGGEITLGEVINSISWINSKRHLLIVLSSKHEDEDKTEEIREAERVLGNIQTIETIDNFQILEGGFHGFCACF